MTKKIKVSVSVCGYGTYKVRVMYRGKEYTCFSHNSGAYDRVRNLGELSPLEKDESGYTLRQALLAFYDECKELNNL